MPSSTAPTLDTSINDKLLQLVNRNAVIRKLDLRETKGERRLISGYANVSDIEDSQGDVMSHDALVNAWNRWSGNPDFCILSLLHSNIPLAKVVFEEVTDSKGITHRSGVDETGLYIVAEVRRDVTLADEIWGKIQSGEFRGFSIGGRNLNPQPETCTGTRCVRPITDLELYEVAIVDHPANQVSLFNMLKRDDLAKLADATKHLQEQVYAAGAVKISKHPCPETGKYRVLVKEGIDVSKLLCPDKFAIVTEPVEGEEYVTLFDVALLRPESALTGETLGGGVNPSSPQANAPDTPAPQEELILENNEVKEMESEQVSSKEDESGLAKAPEEAIAPITLETLMAQLARAIERIDSLEKRGVEKVEKSADPAPPVEPTPPPAEPVAEPVKEAVIQAPVAPPQEESPVKAEPTMAVVVPVVQPAPAPTPIPSPKVEEIETRGIAQPIIPVNQGLDLGGIYKKVSWQDINEALEASKKRK